MTTMTKSTKDIPELGKLKSMGLREPYDVALIVPDGYIDARYPMLRFAVHGESLASHGIVVGGRIKTAPAFGRSGSGAPRLQIVLVDDAGAEMGVTLFGVNQQRDAFYSEMFKRGITAYFTGSAVITLGAKLWLSNASPVSSKYIGRVLPVYPGKRGQLKPESVRAHVQGCVRLCLAPAADQLLAAAFPLSKSESVCRDHDIRLLRALVPQALDNHPHPPIWSAIRDWVATQLMIMHNPPVVEFGQDARINVSRLGALALIRTARAQQGRAGSSKFRTPGDWAPRASRLPFALSPSQRAAIEATMKDLSADASSRRIITGEVGSGKTIVFGLIAAAVVDGGGRAAILLPSDTLAQQVTQELSGYFPDISQRILRVEAGAKNADATEDAALLIGTTALLHNAGHLSFDLIVVDEEHKFSVNQREGLLDEGAHLVEVTATPIPRTRALIEYAGIPVSRLESHTDKTIVTTLYSEQTKAQLFAGVRESLARQEKVLVVYPLREDSTANDSSSLQSAMQALNKWRKAVPGANIDVIHANLPSEHIASVLGAFASGDLQVLLSTSIVETGLNIPGLMRVVVVNAERHGLSALHQIRGRVARWGGTGYCDLLPTPGLKKEKLDRLQVLVDTTDGFELALQDMKLRGAGDITATGASQSGTTPGTVFGNPLFSEYLEETAMLLTGPRISTV